MAKVIGYTIRDVDFMLERWFKSLGFVIRVENRNVVVPVVLSTIDPEYYKKKVPCIIIEPGFDIEKRGEWQPRKTHEYRINPTDPKMSDLTIGEVVDIHYSYRVTFYVPFRGAVSVIDQMLLCEIPSPVFSLEGKNEAGESFIVPFDWDGTVYTPDRNKDYDAKAQGLPSAEVSGVDRVHKREFVLTAQLMFEKERVVTAMRPYAGVLTEMEIIEEV